MINPVESGVFSKFSAQIVGGWVESPTYHDPTGPVAHWVASKIHLIFWASEDHMALTTLGCKPICVVQICYPNNGHFNGEDYDPNIAI